MLYFEKESLGMFNISEPFIRLHILEISGIPYPPVVPNRCLNCDTKMTIVSDRPMYKSPDEEKIRYICPKCFYAENTEYAWGKWNFFIKEWLREERQTLLMRRGISPEQRYYCTKCRCRHRAGSERGFMHIEHRDNVVGDTNKCVICKKVLPKGRRKFCGDVCVERNRNTCQKCGVYFGAGCKRWGHSSERLCSHCSWTNIHLSFQRFAKGVALEDDYRLLGLNPDCSIDEITTRYRELAKKHHPDVGGDAKAFIDISDAYENLMKNSRSI